LSQFITLRVALRQTTFRASPALIGVFANPLEQIGESGLCSLEYPIPTLAWFALHQSWKGTSMSLERALSARSARVIVVGNEKGGSGKSTVAIHVAVALMKSGQRVATIDLDSRQRSLTRSIENRRAWAKQIGRDLEIPAHVCVAEQAGNPTAEDDAAAAGAFLDTVDELARANSVIVIDTPGAKTHLAHLVHAMADTLCTPLNDSFVDLDVLGLVDPETFRVTGTSHYAKTVAAALAQRSLYNPVPSDWIVLRNRLSMTATRNKRQVGEALQELSQLLNFRLIDGLGERMIFREFYPRGLTALDDINETTLGTRPTMSHVTARREVQGLIDAMKLNVGQERIERDRDAA
jgi:chromosome partitioning protein